MSSLTRLRFLLRSSGQRIHALAFGGAPHAAQACPLSPSRLDPGAKVRPVGIAAGRSRRRAACRASRRRSPFAIIRVPS
jgi:hypothetical protein